MRKIYLLLAIIGFIAPTTLLIMESIESGNILLYVHPLDTIEAMFVNRISSIFMIDLLFAVTVFFIWTYKDSKIAAKKLTTVWVLTMLLGLAGGFPLYLYFREKAEK